MADYKELLRRAITAPIQPASNAATVAINKPERGTSAMTPAMASKMF